ncbi:hypothetical protein OA252_02540 [Candidatus Pelagibacter sp.]|nr:hypothetical protein [Candidatus Pelagibacter sp.]
MIKKLIKLKILKFALIGGISVAYTFKKYCDQKNKLKSKKDKKTLLITR